MTRTEPDPAAAVPSSLRPAARSGARLGLVVGLSQQLLSIFATLVLVRILTRSDIGLAAIAVVIVGFASLFTSAGFGQIIVKRAQLDERVNSTIFWTAAGVGLLASAVIAALAVPLAIIAGQREAAPLVVILAPTVLVGCIGSVPRALLQRRMQFRRMYAADLSAMVMYVVVQIALALLGAGAASVVLGQLASALVVLVVCSVSAHWLPHLVFDRVVARQEARFGGGTLANTMLTYVVKNADYWVVSRTSSAATLGVYYIAYVLPNILRQRLTWMATDVLLPVFARLVDDRERGRRAYRQSLSLHAFIGFPTMTGIAVLATDVVAVFFGRQWADAAQPLSILAMAALVEFVTQAATTVFIAHGIPGRNAVIKIYSAIVMLTGLAIFHGYGLGAVAGCVLAGSVTGALVSQVLVGRLLGFGLRDATVALSPVIGATAVMAVVVAVLQRLLTEAPHAVTLAACVPAGALVYLAAGRLLAPALSRELLHETIAIAIPRARRKYQDHAPPSARS